MYYASLVGPLLGIYYRLPFQDPFKNRTALNLSRLAKLWGDIYTETQVDELILKYGGLKFEAHESALDYDFYKLTQIMEKVK